MKIYIVGSINMDLVVRAPFMPKSGMTIEGNGFMTNPGGKGANQAVACAKLGGKTYMVGCVGEAFGDELFHALRGYGVDTRYTEKHGNVSSGIAVIVVVDGDNRIILDRGANGEVTTSLVDRALESGEAGDYLILQLEVATEIVAYALKAGKARGMVTMLNPAPAKRLPEEIFADCDYFLPNQTEAEFYTGIYPKDEESAKACAEAFANMGVKRTVITMGEQGSVCVCEGRFLQAKPYPVDAVDTTAAGDTYVGALAVKLSEGESLEEAMRFASAASSITVTRVGAQQAIPTREEVDKLV